MTGTSSHSSQELLGSVFCLPLQSAPTSLPQALCAPATPVFLALPQGLWPCKAAPWKTCPLGDGNRKTECSFSRKDRGVEIKASRVWDHALVLCSILGRQELCFLALFLLPVLCILRSKGEESGGIFRKADPMLALTWGLLWCHLASTLKVSVGDFGAVGW